MTRKLILNAGSSRDEGITKLYCPVEDKKNAVQRSSVLPYDESWMKA